MKPCRFWTAAFIGLLLLPSVAAGADATKEALQKGKASFDKGDYDAAIAAFSELIRLDPKNAEAYFYRAGAFSGKGEYDKAIADCSEAIRLKPGYANAYSGRAFAFTMKGDQHEAIADCSEVIRLNPKDAKAYYNRGIVYVKEGEYDKAIVNFTEAIRLDQKDATAYAARGSAFGNKRDYEKAVADFTAAIRLNPNLAEAYCSRGWTYECKGDHDKAIADLDAAVRLGPKRPCYYEARGAIRIRRGDYEGGIADLQTAVRLDPHDPAAKFETLPGQTLTEAAIQHGEQQVRQLLRDRPAMAQYGEKAAVLYRWAARKFAGEDLHERFLWDASEPALCDADNQSPTTERSGRIRIRRTYCDGVQKGKEQSFESMWSKAVFELYNIANAQDFQRLIQAAAAGQLTKETFVAKIVECESRAAEKTRAFYIHVFLPWAREQHLPTDPQSWYVAGRSDSRENLLLSHVDKRAAYWRSYSSSR